MRNHVIEEVEKLAEKDDNIVLINGDLGFGVLDNFEKKFSERFINSGICEQNMMGVAAGLGLCGKTVFVYSIGNFPGMRCLEQIRNDVCYHNANVKIIVVGGGFAYGQLGMSHHATEDIAIMNALPNMRIYSPSDPISAVECVRDAYRHVGPCYIRLGKGGEPNIYRDGEAIHFPLNELAKGSDVAIVATGSIISEAIDARDALLKKDICIGIYDFLMIKGQDFNMFDIFKKYKYILSIEEHNISGGIGSIIADYLCSKSLCNIKLIKIGLNDEYTSIVGDQKYLRQHYGMNSDKIQEIVKGLLLPYSRK